MTNKMNIALNTLLLATIFMGGYVVGFYVSQPEPEIIHTIEYRYIEADSADEALEMFITSDDLYTTDDIPEMKPTREKKEALECLAKVVWGEARGCSLKQKEAVAWCILNRVDSEKAFFPDSIVEVVTQPNQFIGYNKNHPIDKEIYDIVSNVMDMWCYEKEGEVVDRVLPKDYLYFYGDGKINHFSKEWNSKEVLDLEANND